MQAGKTRPQWAVAGAVALALALTGCTGGAPYSAATASRLQHGVLAVAQAASADHLAVAQQQLTDLERMNNAAARNGEISPARHASIAASIASVRADLTQLQDQAAQARIQQLQQAQLQQDQQDQQRGDGKGKGKPGKGDNEGGG